MGGTPSTTKYISKVGRHSGATRSASFQKYLYYATDGFYEYSGRALITQSWDGHRPIASTALVQGLRGGERGWDVNQEPRVTCLSVRSESCVVTCRLASLRGRGRDREWAVCVAATSCGPPSPTHTAPGLQSPQPSRHTLTDTARSYIIRGVIILIGSQSSRGGYPLAALGSEDWCGVVSDGRPSVHGVAPSPTAPASSRVSRE